MEFGMSDLLRMIKKRWIAISVLTTILVVATAITSIYVLEPEYEATSTLLVQSESEGNQISYNNLVTNQQLVRTYIQIFRSRTITEDVINRLNLSVSSEELLKKVKFHSVEDSLITRITVLDRDPNQAVEIANTFSQSFQDNLRSIMMVNNVSTLDEASIHDVIQVKPQPWLNSMIALVIGLMLSMTYTFLKEVMNTLVNTEHELEKLISVPTLGVIPTYGNQQSRKKLICRSLPKSPISEAYRTLRTNILYDPRFKQLKSLMITSTIGMEGKTTTISNLAITMVDAGKKVILIDADMRKPSLHHYFRIDNNQGLSELLSGQITLEESIVRVDEGLDIIAGGSIPDHPSELLGSSQMKEVVQQLKEHYDIVLFDTPPILPVTDGQILSTHVDGVLLLLNSGKVYKEHLLTSKSLLDRVGARVIGTILNNKKMEQMHYYTYQEDSPKRLIEG